jgi:FdhD protein
MESHHRVETLVWRNGRLAEGSRAVPEEYAVAVSYNGSSYAVMMATPDDLEDFAIGFSLTEGVITCLDDIQALETIEHDAGIELQIWLANGSAEKLRDRRRYLAGPTGCGLCGIEQLSEAMRPVPPALDGVRYSPEQIMAAVEAISDRQTLNRHTHAAHAAAFWQPELGIVALREDVGRHNALDKLVGALATRKQETGSGIGVLTSRISVEMVQKAAIAGLPILAAVSAPSALAISTAAAAGMTLIGIARRDGFEVFTRPDRVASQKNHT